MHFIWIKLFYFYLFSSSPLSPRPIHYPRLPCLDPFPTLSPPCSPHPSMDDGPLQLAQHFVRIVISGCSQYIYPAPASLVGSPLLSPLPTISYATSCSQRTTRAEGKVTITQQSSTDYTTRLVVYASPQVCLLIRQLSMNLITMKPNPNNY